MERKIVAIVPTINNPYSVKRIVALQATGAEVVVYGFEREKNKVQENLPFSYTILGQITRGNYLKRMQLYRRSFKKLSDKLDKKNTIFYIVGLSTALFFLRYNRGITYIYDECDLSHTYLKIGSGLLEYLDKKIINKSALTVTTSEGFIKYHFKDQKPKNILLVENKLDRNIIEIQSIPKQKSNGINIGFVGFPRFKSIFNFIDVFCSHFPNNDFHIFGGPIDEEFKKLEKYTNCHFHGFFKNPQDLPSIYSMLDLVLCTYDVKYDNVRVAEPNKLYESIYFCTPIIVSSGTFLSEKVERLGVGYSIDALDNNAIIDFVNGLKLEDVRKKQEEITTKDRMEAVRDDAALIERINGLMLLLKNPAK